ncbi:hypothetical protein EWB00_010305, partial [Schistosoma japonicum]
SIIFRLLTTRSKVRTRSTNFLFDIKVVSSTLINTFWIKNEYVNLYLIRKII